MCGGSDRKSDRGDGGATEKKKSKSTANDKANSAGGGERGSNVTPKISSILAAHITAHAAGGSE